MSFSSDQPQVINQLPQTVNLPDMKDQALFKDEIEELFKNIADTVNGKTGGLYSLQERGSSVQYYSKTNENVLRDVYRKTFDLAQLNGGSILASQTIQFQHEFTNLHESAGIYAHCTSVDGIFFTTTFPNIRLNRTSIVFTNPYTQALTQCDVVANILKN